VSLWLKFQKSEVGRRKSESQLFKKLVFSQVALRLRLALVQEKQINLRVLCASVVEIPKVRSRKTEVRKSTFKKPIFSQVALRLRLALVHEKKLIFVFSVSLWLKSPKAQKFNFLKPESQLFKKLVFSQVALRLRLALVEEVRKSTF